MDKSTADSSTTSERQRKLQPLSLTSMLGPASNMTFLLSDYSRFSLTERVSYHFHLTEALADSSLVMSGVHQTQSASQQLSINNNKVGKTGEDEKQFFHVCGIKRLLECIPTKPRPTRQERRALKVSVHRANQVAKKAFEEGTSYCHEPPAEKLPLRLNPSTRVFFAYQRTRIALLVDASPTITATHGFGVFGSQNSKRSTACCPLDIIPRMTNQYLTSLIDPIALHDSKDVWNPSISISVLAVFPATGSSRDHQSGEDIPDVSILVRDYNLTDKQSVDVLCSQLGSWLHSTVEEEISTRLMQHRPSFLWEDKSSSAYHSQQSSLREWLEVGDAALSTMSSEARPLLVVATDCRSVECDSVVNILAAENRVDQPLSILNVGPEGNGVQSAISPGGRDLSVPTIAEFMDRNSYSTPLHISDDSQALFEICNATNGCFWDWSLLDKAAFSRVGKIAEADSPFLADHFVTNRRHTIHPTLVQWYTLFSLSPITPISNQSFGRLPLVKHYRPESLQRMHHGPNISGLTKSQADIGAPRLGQTIRTTFSMYVINPIRIQNLLQMRVREGYRARRYGARTNDPDRVDILFTLGLDLDTCLQYELSYKALSGYQHMVGSAQIKIYLSGEANFINSVKKEFVQPPDASSLERNATLSQQLSSRLCRMLRWIRKEDMLQSYIAPLEWKDQLVKGAPFLRRLGTLTEQQRRRHFRIDQFDLVCTGRLPYNRFDDAEFLNAFQDNDSGEKNLLQGIAEWSTQLVDVAGRAGTPSRFRFLRKMPSPVGTLASYCLLDIKKCQFASRIYTITVETFGIAMASDRISWLNTLQSYVDDIKDCSVLQKQIAPYLVEGQIAGVTDRQRALLEMQHNHAAWELIDDQELLPLITKRRVEIDGFYLVASNDNFAFLAKLMPGKDVGDPGDLVQYRITKTPTLVSVDLHMEIEAGVLFPFSEKRPQLESQYGLQFNQLSEQLEKTDKQCGTALRSRTNLLSSLAKDLQSPIFVEKQSVSLATILPHTSKLSMKLRFFQDWSTSANEILKSLIRDFFLSIEDGTKVGRLSIETDENVPGYGSGDWLVLEYDPETMSLVHIAENQLSEVTDGISKSTREVTFNTLSTSDLYFTRQEGVFVEEYMPVSNLSEALDAIHGQLYAVAAFASLRKDKNNGQAMHLEDFVEVKKSLVWREVSRVVIASGSMKLVEMIKTAVEQVQGQESYFYYVSEANSNQWAEEDSSSIDEYANDSESSESYDEASQVTDDIDGLGEPSTDDNEGGERALDHLPGSKYPSNPLFFRFLVDDLPATSSDLASIGKSSTVSACVSVFSENNKNSPLPKSHTSAGAHLSSILQSFVSEQTLERLRFHGAWIEEADLHLAKLCLRRARDVQRSLVELRFYVPKVDQLVRATTSGGGDDNIERGFAIFSEQLRRNSSLHLVRFGVGFVVVGIGTASEQELPFWCFLTVKKQLGGVMVKVHHPEGAQSARNVLETVRMEILKTCHQANQLMLLHHMHTSRTASHLLVPEDADDGSIDPIPPEKHSSNAEFACPALFKFRFELFHRCAQSAVQVAMALESTVLHIFALSNRRHIFVYKDEGDSIFYMSLKASDGDEGKLELHVHGVHAPSTSVTTQLTALLSKRLMQIGLDMLSLVLTKNPHFSWKDADIEFVRNFNRQLQRIEGSTNVSPSATDQLHVTTRGLKPCRRLYAFPLSCFDLGLVMLCFRQNLCGSTYFQPLVVGSTKLSEVESEESTLNEDLGDISNLADSLNFTCFYNNSPSKLNTALQAQSTLTRKGEEFRRAVGTGMAIINIALLDANGDVHGLGLGTTTPVKWKADGIPSIIDVTDEKQHGSDHSEARLIVSIEDTNLDTAALHGWIMLTLNQVLAGWTMERHIEMHQKVEQRSANALQAGLDSLVSMIESSSLLPHPAAKTWKDTGSIRAPDVADMALRLLEKGLEPMYHKMKAASKGFLEKHVKILRQNGNLPPHFVKIERDRESGNRKVLVWELDSSGTEKIKRVQDRPIDSPEYSLCLQLPDLLGTDKPRVSVPPRLFTNVSLPDEHRKQFMLLRDMNQGAFRRVFSLVLRVSRKNRLLFAYNWELALFDSVTRALADECRTIMASHNATNTLLERRALGVLCSRTGGFLASVDERKATTSSSGGAAENNMRGDEDKASRRRPIRKPKLIGKSVEGAAVQALAASRARASLKTQPSRSPSGGRITSSRNNRKPTRQIQKKTTVRLSKSQALMLRLQRDIHFQIFARNSCKRLHTMQNEIQCSIWKHLELFESKHKSEALADLFFREGSIAWSRAIPIFKTPHAVLENLLLNVGSAFATRLKGLKILPLSVETQPDTFPSVLLLTPSRNVRYSKCCAAGKLQIEETNGRLFIVFQAFRVLTAREKKSQPLKYGYLLEKDSTAFDILSGEILSHNIESMVFDFLASAAGGIMKSYPESAEGMMLFESLEKRYPLSKQLRMFDSGLKVVKLPLILPSYRNKFINLFTSEQLFDWLKQNNHNMALVGASALLFQRDIVVKGTHNTIALTCVPEKVDQLALLLICRANGKDLNEYVFEQNQRVAQSLLSSICVHIAGAIYEELVAAATELYRDLLWTQAKGESSSMPSSEDLLQLIDLSYLSDTEQGGENLELNLMLEGLGDDTVRGVERMLSDPSFWPSYRLDQEGKQTTWMYYFSLEDLFLMARTDGEGTAKDKKVTFQILSRTRSDVSVESCQIIVQKASNFFLYNVWRNFLHG